METQLFEYEYGVAEGKLREKAIRLHHQRYREVGYYHPDEKDIYETQSVYLTARIAKTDQVIGVIRLIFADLPDLPTIKYFDIYDLEKARLQLEKPFSYIEISAFTKLPQHEVSMGLIREAMRYSFSHHINQWICCVDEKVFHYMNRVFKFPFKQIGQSQVYLGSVSIPCTIDFQECLRQTAIHKPKLFHFFTENHPDLRRAFNG